MMRIEQSRSFLTNPLMSASAGVIAVAAAFVIGRAARPERETPTQRSASAAPAAALSSREHFASIEAEFAKEGSDAAWNPADELRGKLSAMLPQGSLVRALECRRSMCRLETVHRDMDAYRQFSDGFRYSARTPLWSGATVFDVRDPARGSEEVVAVGYLARKSLPNSTPR